jgi:hypothetical protein
MSCANTTYASASAIVAPTPSRWHRPRVIKAMTIVIEAFREALIMRRAAQRKYFLDDE